MEVGYAWRQNGKVYWKKGINDIEAEYDFIKSLSLPIVIHFRVIAKEEFQMS